MRVVLNGNSEEGQTLLFPFYCISFFLILCLLTLHIRCTYIRYQREKNEGKQMVIYHNGDNCKGNSNSSNGIGDIINNKLLYSCKNCCNCNCNCNYKCNNNNIFQLITYKQIIQLLTSLSMILGMMYMVSSVLNYYQFKRNSCKYSKWSNAALIYTLHKYCIFECLIVRLQASFSNSVYAYSKCLIWSLHIGNTILVLGLGVSLSIEMRVVYVQEVASNGGYICYSSFPFWCGVVSATLDMCCNITLLLLFLKPVITIARQQQRYEIEHMTKLPKSIPHIVTTTTTTTTTTSTSTSTIIVINDNTNNNTKHKNNTKNNVVKTTIKSTDGQPSQPEQQGEKGEGEEPENNNDDTEEDNEEVEEDEEEVEEEEVEVEEEETEEDEETKKMKEKRYIAGKKFKNNSIMYKLSIKSTVVTFVMILVTIISMGLFVIKAATIGVTIELFINCLCLMLISAQYDPLYRYLCKGCDAGVSFCGDIFVQ